MKSYKIKRGINKTVRLIMAITFAVIVAGLILAAGNVGMNLARDFVGNGKSNETVAFTIADGESMESISERLKDHGVIDYPLFFRGIYKIQGEPTYTKGEHSLRASMTYDEIIKKIGEVTKDNTTIKVLIPEGFNLSQITDAVTSKLNITAADFAKAVNSGVYNYPFIDSIPRQSDRFEGYLFPATYEFTQDATATTVVKLMLDKFDDEFDEQCKNRAEQLGMTIDEVITLASIIEAEAKGDDDRALVSSVFHNRLKLGMKLESCSTVQFVLKTNKPVLSYDDIATPSPYNTYIVEGLPEGPICSPGKASIIAALYPENSDYLYFALNEDNVHEFNTTLEEHEKVFKQVQ